MLNAHLLNVFLACLSSLILIYGSWSILVEAVRTILPFGLLLAIFLTGLIHFLRVPCPSAESVEAILGKEPHLAEENDSHVIKTIAHRGAALDAPENSLAAFKYCKDKGCDTIEFDVSLTADDVAIVFHDPTLERMANSDLVISKSNWAELSKLDIGVNHPFKDHFQGTNIPTLEQTVTQLLASGQKMFIDLKDSNFKMVRIIQDLFQRHPNLYSSAVVTSLYPSLIYMIRRGDPGIVCALSWRPCSSTHETYCYPNGQGDKLPTKWFQYWLLRINDIILEWALPRIIYYFLGLSVVLLHKDVICGKSILDWRERGVRVMTWTVNSPADKQYFAKILKITYLTDTMTAEVTTHSMP